MDELYVFSMSSLKAESECQTGRYRFRVSDPPPLPKIGAPATRALRSAGYHSLEDLDGASRRMLLDLHGVGPRALQVIDEAMSATTLSLAD